MARIGFTGKGAKNEAEWIEKRQKMRSLRSSGHTLQEIAEMLSVSSNCVRMNCLDIEIQESEAKFFKERRLDIVKMRDNGITWREIARKHLIGETTARGIYARAKARSKQ